MNHDVNNLICNPINIGQNNLPVWYTPGNLGLPSGTENLINVVTYNLIANIQQPQQWTPFRVYLYNQMIRNGYNNSDFASFVKTVCAVCIVKQVSNVQAVCAQAVGSKAAWNASVDQGLSSLINQANQQNVLNGIATWQDALQMSINYDNQQNMYQNNMGGANAFGIQNGSVRSNWNNNGSNNGYNAQPQVNTFDPNSLTNNRVPSLNNSLPPVDNTNGLGFGSWNRSEQKQNNTFDNEVVSSKLYRASDMPQNNEVFDVFAQKETREDKETISEFLNPSKLIELPVSRYSFIESPSIVYSPKYGQRVVKSNGVITKLIKGDNMDIERHLNSLHDINSRAPVASNENQITVAPNPDTTIDSIKVKATEEMITVSLQGVDFKIAVSTKEDIPLVTSTSELEPGFNAHCYKNGLLGSFSQAAIATHVTLVKKDKYDKIKEVLSQGGTKHTLAQWRGLITDLKEIDSDVFEFMNTQLTTYVNNWITRRGILITIDDFCSDLLDLDTALRNKIDVSIGKSNYDDFYLGMHSLPMKFVDHDSNVYVTFCTNYSIVSDENISVDESIDDVPVIFNEISDILYLNISSKKLDINYDGKVGFLMASTTPVLYHALYTLMKSSNNIKLITSDRIKYMCCASPYDKETILISKI